MSTYHAATTLRPLPSAPAPEGFTVRMIRLWIEHYERLLGFNVGPL